LDLIADLRAGEGRALATPQGLQNKSHFKPKVKRNQKDCGI